MLESKSHFSLAQWALISWRVQTRCFWFRGLTKFGSTEVKPFGICAQESSYCILFLCLTSLAPRRAGISLGAITPPSLSVLVSQCSFEINDLLPFCLVGAASVSTRLAALRWQWEDVEGSGCGQKVALNRKAVRADKFWLRHFWNAKGNLTKPKSQLWQLILLEVQCSPLMQEHEVFLPLKKKKKIQNQWSINNSLTSESGSPASDTVPPAGLVWDYITLVACLAPSCEVTRIIILH